MSQREPVSVFVPKNEWQGELLLQHLRAAGIDGYLANRASAGLWGDGLRALAKLEILVPDDQVERAMALIDEFLAETSSPEKESSADADDPSSA